MLLFSTGMISVSPDSQILRRDRRVMKHDRDDFKGEQRERDPGKKLFKVTEKVERQARFIWHWRWCRDVVEPWRRPGSCLRSISDWCYIRPWNRSASAPPLNGIRHTRWSMADCLARVPPSWGSSWTLPGIQCWKCCRLSGWRPSYCNRATWEPVWKGKTTLIHFYITKIGKIRK